MDKKLTFLELPLDRDLYKPKKISECCKPPLRVLITEAGTKTARHLMYKICSGDVFGHDQPVILHLVNARGCVSHKATLLDLEECGFSVLEDSVVTADAEKSYAKVDVVVLLALFEELSGHSLYNAFLCQLNKTRNVEFLSEISLAQAFLSRRRMSDSSCYFVLLNSQGNLLENTFPIFSTQSWMCNLFQDSSLLLQARNFAMYAKPDAKLIVCSPSSKGVIVLLACIRMFEPQLNIQHITGVVFLDETIAKALVAAQLKTTTDKIKNLVIWGATCPDILNATVNMYPPEDGANLQKKNIPVMKVLENQKWIYSDFIPKIYKRVLGPELVKHGTAVASATAKHLKLLFQGSDSQEEIVSMGIIVPPNEPYGMARDLSFSFPVVTKNGVVTVQEGVECAITTELIKMKNLYNFQNDTSVQEVFKIIKFIKEFEETTKKDFMWSQHTYLTDKKIVSSCFMKFLISPRRDESSQTEDKEVTSKKSITWEVAHLSQKSSHRNVKSVLRFDLGKAN